MEYHDDFSCIGKSMLSVFLRSRQEYYYTYITREMPPKVVGKPGLIGNVLHAVLLEEQDFSDVVQVYPENVLKCNGDLDGKKAARHRAEFSSTIFVKSKEYDYMEAVVAGVMQDRNLSALLAAESKREERIDGKVDGVDCKCKPDLLCDLGDYLACYDFKFMEDVSPGAWRRSCKRLHYWLQDAHYSAVLQSTFGKPVTFRFFCIETQFPYRVIPRWYDPASRETARIEHRKIISDLAACYASGDWSDVWGNVCVLEPWDIAGDGEPEVQLEEVA